MVYNYLQLVESYLAGEPKSVAQSQFITNNRDTSSGKPLDLVYPSGDVACFNNGNYFHIGEPLNRSLPDEETRWIAPQLFRQEDDLELTPGTEGIGVNRSEYQTDQGELLLTEGDICEILGPVIDSLNRNLPVVAYTGISMSDEPHHIVVFSGYERRDGELWLHVDDPADMDSTGRSKKEPLLEDSSENVLEVVQPGEWEETGAKYWLKARRLFEPQQNSSADNDLWCDYEDEQAEDDENRNGLCVYLHPSYKVPPSPYASGNVIAHVPVDLGDGATALGGETQAERLEAAYQQTEQMEHMRYHQFVITSIAPVPKVILASVLMAICLFAGCNSDDGKVSNEFVSSRSSVEEPQRQNEPANVEEQNESRKAKNRVALRLHSDGGERIFLVVADTLAVRVDTLFPGGSWRLARTSENKQDKVKNEKLVFECLAPTNSSASVEPCLAAEGIGDTVELQGIPDVVLVFNIDPSINDRKISLYINGYHTRYPPSGDIYHYLEFYRFPTDGVLPLNVF